MNEPTRRERERESTFIRCHFLISIDDDGGNHENGQSLSGSRRVEQPSNQEVQRAWRSPIAGRLASHALWSRGSGIQPRLRLRLQQQQQRQWVAPVSSSPAGDLVANSARQVRSTQCGFAGPASPASPPRAAAAATSRLRGASFAAGRQPRDRIEQHRHGRFGIDTVSQWRYVGILYMQTSLTIITLVHAISQSRIPKLQSMNVRGAVVVCVVVSRVVHFVF